MGKYKRLLSNTAILGAGTFASKVLVFILMPFYTSILSTAEYGTADIITQTASLIIPLAAVGICDALFRFTLDVPEEDADGKKRVFTSAMLVLCAGSALTAAGVQLLRLFDVFEGYVWLVAAYVICSNFHSAAAYFVRALGKTTLFAAQGIANTGLTVALNIVFLAVFRMGVLGYVLSVVVSDLCMTVLLFAAARLYRYFLPRTANRDTLRAMLKFGLPYIPTTVMWLVTSACDRYIVTAYKGSAENGLYAAAYKLPTVLLLVCGVFLEAWQFSVVKDADGGEREHFFSDVYKSYTGIIFIGASVITAGAKLFTKLLLADSYYSSWQYVPVLALAMAFSAIVSFLGSVYFLEKKSMQSMITAVAGAVINIVINFMLIPEHGAMGAAVATFISYAAVYAIRAYDTRFYVKFQLHTARLLVNTAVLLLQTLAMLGEVRYWKYMQAIAVVFMLVFNGREIFAFAVDFSKSLVKKLKKDQKN